MKVIILAGGLGTRLPEYTKSIPKPMINIKGKPIIRRIIEHYKKYDYKNFIIASGYKGKIIKNYFKKNFSNKDIKVIDTGKSTMTGGRIKRLETIIGNERFMLTYGDGISDINLKKLLNFHKKNKNIITLTAVRPPARFGGIKLVGSKVKYFKEKSRLDEGWINGGFMIIEPEIFQFLTDDSTIFERDPLERICRKNKLGAYKHNGFWQCMDTIRDKEILEKNISKKS